VSVGFLPPGLTLCASTGLLSGTPTAIGIYPFTVQVADSASPANTAFKAFTMDVVSPMSVGLTIHSAYLVGTNVGLPMIVNGAAFSTTLYATGGSGGTAWAVSSGALPPGMLLGATTGAISGTPTAPGSYVFTVSVTDSAGTCAFVSVTMFIGAQGGAAPVVLTPSLPTGTPGIPYSATFAAAGGVTPYFWSIVSSNLPPGSTLDPETGELKIPSGGNASYGITVKVTDAGGQTAQKTFTIIVGTFTTIAGTGETPSNAGGGSEGGCGMVGLEAILLLLLMGGLRMQRRGGHPELA